MYDIQVCRLSGRIEFLQDRFQKTIDETHVFACVRACGGGDGRGGGRGGGKGHMG